MTIEQRVSPWRQPRRWVPLLLSLFVIGAFAVYRITSTSGVNRDLEALRSKGLPTTPIELDKWYTYVPAEENAALAFIDAFALYNAPLRTNNPSEIKGVEMSLGEPLPERLAQAVELLVINNRDAIQQAHKAAQLTKSRYPIDLTKGFATLLPHLAQMRSMAQLLKWEAVWQSAHGKKEEALRSVRSGFALSDSLQNEPLLISELVRIVIANEALTALERVVTEQNLTDAELTAYLDLLARTEEQGKNSMHRAMVGERGGGISIFKADYRAFEMMMGGVVGTGGNLGEDFLKIAVFQLRRGLGVADRDLVFYLSMMKQYEAAAQKSYPEMIKDTEDITSQMQQEFAKSRFRYMISGMMLPSLEKASLRAAIAAGQLRCARVALAAERYRLKHGEPPPLDALVPYHLKELPRDPVSGEALEYEKIPNGFRIYAVDATDRKTEGGRKKNQSEVAFTVLRWGVETPAPGHDAGIDE